MARRAPDGERLRALDGLRGVAALVVLLSHVVEGGIGPLSETLTFGGDPGGVWHWFMRTPLAVVWAGPEFVMVFFVLSAFVLTRALLRERVSPAAFYAGRAVRLYVPVWASLVPGAILAAVPAAGGPAIGVGPWLAQYAHPVGLEQVARDMALVLAPSSTPQGTLNGVLWSLRWEVLFSLALPLVLAGTGAVRRAGAVIIVGSLLCVMHGGGSGWMAFAPPFAIGVVLALHEDRIRRWRAELRGRGAAAFVVLGLCLLSADLWVDSATRAAGGAGALVVAGATAAVLAPLLYGSVACVLERRPMQWLGSRSFSLYLVHHPIVLAFANGLSRPAFLVLLAAAVPTSLLAAEVFHRVVERPVHRAARRATSEVRLRMTSCPCRADAPVDLHSSEHPSEAAGHRQRCPAGVVASRTGGHAAQPSP